VVIEASVPAPLKTNVFSVRHTEFTGAGNRFPGRAEEFPGGGSESLCFGS